MKLKDIIKECGCLTEPDGTIKGGPKKKDDEWNKGLNEFVGIISIAALMKYLIRWTEKNPQYIKKLKDFVNKL